MRRGRLFFRQLGFEGFGSGGGFALGLGLLDGWMARFALRCVESLYLFDLVEEVPVNGRHVGNSVAPCQ